MIAMSENGPTLPIIDFRFDGEFRRDSGLVVLNSSFVELDQNRQLSPMAPAASKADRSFKASERHDSRTRQNAYCRRTQLF